MRAYAKALWWEEAHPVRMAKDHDTQSAEIELGDAGGTGGARPH